MAEKLVSSPFHFFRSDDFLICLACKERICGQNNFDVDFILSEHIKANTHQENVNALFNFCVPEWDGSHVEIVQELVFDLTILKNESSYVSEIGNHLVCSVCEETIVQCSNTKELKTSSLINHMNSLSHLQKLKNDASWVYCLEDKFTFIMFYKSVAYCSICKEDVQSSRTCPVKKAVEHLGTYHPDKMLKDPQNTQFYETPHSKHSSTDDKNLSHSFKMLSMSKTCDEFEDSTEGSDRNSEIGENSSDLVDSQKDTFTCPECGESITIYNGNLDFSVDLHKQTHKSLSSINADSSLNYQEDADYVCPICQETIQVFNKNLDFSFNLHYENQHQLDQLMSADVEAKNKFDFLSRVFDNLPENVREQRGVFIMDGNEVVCKLCNCLVSCTKHVPDACKVFTEHMLNTFHVDQYKAMTELQTEAIDLQTLSLKETNQQNDQLEILSKKCPIIERNKQFLKKQKNNYFCTICEKHICYSPKEDTLISNFVSHLQSYLHKISLSMIKKQDHNRIFYASSNSKTEINTKIRSDLTKEVVNKSLTQKKEKKNINVFEILLKKSSALERNKQFIKKQNINYCCTICEKQINYSPVVDTQILNFVSHLDGKEHEKSLKKVKKDNEKYYENSSSKIQTNSKSSSDSAKKLSSECSSQNETGKKNNVHENVLTDKTIFEDNKNFLIKVKNSYYCILCDKHISFSQVEESQIFHLAVHFKGSFHKTCLKESQKSWKR